MAQMYRALAGSMTGTNPTFRLPQNYGFGDLATYEEARRRKLGRDNYSRILQERDRISSSLNDYGAKLFEQTRPGVYEDLNARGVFTSPTAVSNANAQALKEIALENQRTLMDYDNTALSSLLQGDQDALDAALDLRRGKLEGDLAGQAAGREEALARDLAGKSNRNQLTGSLIGAGGSLGSSLLMSRLLGGGGAAAGASGAGGATATGTGATAAAAPGGGIGSALLPAAGVAAGLGVYEEGRKLLRNQGFGKTTSKVLGAVPGIGLSVGALSKALGGKKKKDEGNSIADFARGLDPQVAEAEQLKAALDSGQITPEEYQEQAAPLLASIKQSVEGAVSRGSKWATAINPFWQRLLNNGVVRAQNNQWVFGPSGMAIA